MLDQMPRRVEGLAERLKARREALGLSQAKLGQRLNPPMSDVQVSNYETGRRSPDSHALRDLAVALECSADHLLGLKEQEARPAKALQDLSTRTPKPEKPAGTLEEAQAQARRMRKTYLRWEGQEWRLRKDGWEPA
jgi:transcriptional regulator with XRE-family HTH domain